MLRRFALFLVTGSLLAACQPPVPDSGAGAGVGFQDYNSYIRNSSGGTASPPSSGAPSASFDPAAASAAIDRASGVSTAPLDATSGAVGTLPATRARGDAPAGIKVETGEMAATAGHAGISDEQDFSAVSARETIASDKARIEQNRAQYVVVQPKDLPVRPGELGPNIVDYALKSTNDPGIALYNRSSLRMRDPATACAKFASPDLAQQEFLAKGGPDKDKLGLDPDGDGFACGWDPRPFRTALN